MPGNADKKPKLTFVPLSKIDQGVRWVSVSYCAGDQWFIDNYGPKQITRYVFATREEAFKAKAEIDEMGCGGGCRGWHIVERALPKEKAGRCIDVERSAYARYGGTIPAIYRIKSPRVPRPSVGTTGQKTSQPGFVYILLAEGTQRIKIGRSFSASVRIETLQTASPYPLKLLRSIASDNVIVLETLLHRRYRTYRRHREWFDLPYDLLMELLHEDFH
jgi:hypothetical protein